MNKDLPLIGEEEVNPAMSADVASVVDATSKTEVAPSMTPDQLQQVLSDLFTAYENTLVLYKKAIDEAMSSPDAELYQQVTILSSLQLFHEEALTHLSKIWSMQEYIKNTREKRLYDESLKDMQKKMDDRKRGLSAVK